MRLLLEKQAKKQEKVVFLEEFVYSFLIKRRWSFSFFFFQMENEFVLSYKFREIDEKM